MNGTLLLKLLAYLEKWNVYSQTFPWICQPFQHISSLHTKYTYIVYIPTLLKWFITVWAWSLCLLYSVTSKGRTNTSVTSDRSLARANEKKEMQVKNDSNVIKEAKKPTWNLYNVLISFAILPLTPFVFIIIIFLFFKTFR